MAYITIANANSIIFKSDLKQVDLKKQIYKIPIYFFSTYEKNALLAFQELLADPEKYFTEVYKPHKPIDSYTLVFEGRHPAYHKDPTCVRLNADFENYEIPFEIRQQGIEKIQEFRLWFSQVIHLLEDRPDAFVARLQSKWGILTNVNAIRMENSGNTQIENYSIGKLGQIIDNSIKNAGRYYYRDEKTQKVLSQYSKYASLWKKEAPLKNNQTGYPDAEVKALLRYYDKTFKKPLKRNLLEYYRIKLNPDIQMEGYLLERLGFRPCSKCHSSKISQHKISKKAFS
jgi:hypothetical protein